MPIAEGLAIIAPGMPSWCTTPGSGRLRTRSTRSGATTRTVLSAAKALAAVPVPRLVAARFAATAAPSKGDPSWKVTPSRSRRLSTVRSSLYVHEVASIGS